jgi:hypothetical protein
MTFSASRTKIGLKSSLDYHAFFIRRNYIRWGQPLPIIHLRASLRYSRSLRIASGPLKLLGDVVSKALATGRGVSPLDLDLKNTSKFYTIKSRRITLE